MRNLFKYCFNLPSSLFRLRSSLSYLSITAILLSGLVACVKDYFDFDKIADSQWTPKFALPMIYSSLTINDIIKMSDKDGYFQIGSDNFVTIVYKGNIVSLRADEIVQIPDNSVSQNLALTDADIPIIPVGETVSYDSSQTITFNTDAQTKIDSLFYKSGNLNIAVNSNIRHQVQMILSIPSLKKNGVSYSETLNLNYAGTLPVTSNSNMNLTGYVFDMTLGGTSSNQFNIDYSVSVTGLGNPLLATDNISIATNISQNKFDKMFGYIGQQLLSPDIDTIKIGLFANAAAGTFELVDAKIKMIVSNSYGVPINAHFDILEGYKPGIGTLPVIIDNAPAAQFQLPIPSPGISQIGMMLKDSFELTDSGGDNPSELIEFQPKYFIYQVYSQANPAGQTQNFLIDTGKFMVDAEIYIPLYGSAKVFTVQDTFDFALPSQDEIDSLLIRMHIANGFPTDVQIQVLFIEDTLTYATIDSVFAPLQNLLDAPAIDGNGRAIGQTEKTIDQWFGPIQMTKIARAKKIFVRGNMSTSEYPKNVKIYSDYKLDVKIGVMAKLKQTISFHNR